MDFIQDSNIRRLRQAIENRASNSRGFTLSDDELYEVYERLMGLVGKATIGKTREQKAMSKQMVIDCIKISIINRKTLYRFPTADEIKAESGNTKLEQKLRLGGFTQEFIENAREVMIQAIHKAKSWEFGMAESLFDDVKFRMKFYCTDSFDKTCQANSTEKSIGRKMLEELKKDFPSIVEYYEKSSIPVDSIFLLGTAWLLTSECKVYWSQERLKKS